MMPTVVVTSAAFGLLISFVMLLVMFGLAGGAVEESGFLETGLEDFKVGDILPQGGGGQGRAECETKGDNRSGFSG